MSYAVLDINLNLIRQNYQKLCSILGSSICSSVVKANAYGVGADVVAPALWGAGCRFFWVAFIDEALKLRKLLPQAHIFVLNGPYEDKKWPLLFKDYSLTPVLNTVEQVEIWTSFLEKENKILPSVLHVDTGMHRLGLPWQEQKKYQVAESHPWPYIISHLSSADLKDHDSHQEQLNKVKELKSLNPKALFSLANSAGIFLGQEFHFDMVRPGAALYGLNPTPYQDNPFEFCLEARLKILQIQSLETGDPVGYGQTFKAPHPMRIATLAGGYSDGIPWRLGGENSQGYVKIKGQRCPIIGRISMDLITVDVTHLSGIEVGDWAILLDEELSADHWAQGSGQISYEILINIKGRFQRNIIRLQPSEKMEKKHASFS